MNKNINKVRSKKSRSPLPIIATAIIIVLIGGVFCFVEKCSYKPVNTNESVQTTESTDKENEENINTAQTLDTEIIIDENQDTSESTTTATSETTVESTETTVEINAQAMDSKYQAVEYYSNKNYDRYNEYGKLHKDYSTEEVVMAVNIGLDKPFYTGYQYVIDTDSILILVNKYNRLKEDYKPKDLVKISTKNTVRDNYLRKEAAEEFEKMCNDARSAGYSVKALSTYRTYQYQQNLYDNYSAKSGSVAADTYSARPGFSEHHTGLCVDVVAGDKNYTEIDQTKDYNFILDYAVDYGFIVRYPEGKSDITGYKYEPWHLRYVGKEVAKYIVDHDITFDEYCAMYL